MPLVNVMVLFNALSTNVFSMADCASMSFISRKTIRLACWSCATTGMTTDSPTLGSKPPMMALTRASWAGESDSPRNLLWVVNVMMSTSRSRIGIIAAMTTPPVQLGGAGAGAVRARLVGDYARGVQQVLLGPPHPSIFRLPFYYPLPPTGRQPERLHLIDCPAYLLHLHHVPTLARPWFLVEI